MRKVWAVVFVCAITMVAEAAENVDPNTFALPERAQLSKCFLDMLTVVKRHYLRKQLAPLLEAGCEREMYIFEAALRPFWKKEYNFDTETMQKIATTMMIGSMEQMAERRYREQSVSFCTGDACTLDAYRKCLTLQMLDDLKRRTKPADFELRAKQKCITQENAARGILTVDFTNAQKLQIVPTLSEKTRNLINDCITEVRHETVVAYAEDLTKVDPTRKSCKPETTMCGNSPCITLGPDRTEYQCAIDYWPPVGNAVITLRFVGARGGPSLANTSWTVLTPDGDVIKETDEVSPRLTLDEGDYVVVVRSNGKIYNRNFQVKPDENREIELTAE